MTWQAATAILRGAACVVSLLALGLAAPPASAQVEGFHYTREITVPAAGWVRVPLDLAALQHLAPGAADLHVFSPAGEELPVRVEPAATRSERRPVKVPKPARTADGGWELVLDLGADPVPHERLFLEGAHPPLSSPDTIESSADGSAWQPLAAGEPSQAGASDDSEWLSISYPRTEDRYLHLHWPREAKTPEILTSEVEVVSGPTQSVLTRNAQCETGQPGASFCTLALPGARQVMRRLTLEVTGAGRVGYRLDAPRDGHWQLQAEGVWQRSGGRTRHLIVGGAEPIADALLRLGLYGSPQAPPRLVSWGVELSVQTVLFRAEAAGRYTLGYGGAPRLEAGRTDLPAGAEAVWLEPGAEIEHALPSLAPAATAPAVRLGNRRRTASWRVIAPAARPGLLVRLELPDAVYESARADLGNLRLAAGERQIPYFLWSPAAPALVIREGALDPEPSDRRSRESEAEIHLPEFGLPLTEMDLSVPPSPLRRTVGVRYQEPAQPLRPNGRRKTRLALVRETWECRPQPPLPCHERLILPGQAPQVLSVRFHDGDNPPLANLEAAVWRRRDVLLFVWPETEDPVRLLAGPDNLRAPSYDLSALGETLLSRPWQPAELSLRGETAAPEPWWNRWVMPATLAIAALCLLLLLRRILAGA
ncbi:MAG TPA: hypothetical protein VGX68_24635 [Thermoanaerobaculia bacterium]|jgi:hypothetical protein|nr:hypothetical protein [Thermoanaerobaculia bacterium]